MNDLLNKNKSANIDKILDPSSDTIVEGIDAATLLNDYYVAIVDKLKGTDPDASKDLDGIYKLPVQIQI